MTLIFFILIFGLVVVSHEFGHFLLAKVNGIRVVEFSVGMGPTLLAFTKGETKYSLKLLPIGGACMFEGEDGLNTVEGEESEGAFNKAGVWARISTVAAGPIFNFILGFIIAAIIVSVPDVAIALPVITVTEDSAAKEAGLQSGDKIISLNGERIYLYKEMSLFNYINGGNEVLVEFERNGERMETKLQPRYNAETGGYVFGVYCQELAPEEGIGRLKYAWYEVRYSVINTYKSLQMLVKGRVESDDVAGPVGIAVNVVGKTYEATKEDGPLWVVLNMLGIALLLSVNLGILNLLPIPALDGGRLVFLLIEVVRGKTIPPEKEGMVHLAGMIFFMGLMVVVFFNDLRNIFG
ncbi:MAG: RIP metalloprotease RseP [Lachnospiraceae bacterium]|nr:RIP metalloprotease RseP [Lachnospiraceae bacterium]